MKFENWIYVTGAPRSGTTFLGKVMSARLDVDYIHEPFNPDCGIPGIEQRFLYLRAGQANDYHSLIERIFTYDFSLRTGYYRNDTRSRKLIKRLVGSRGPFYLRLAKLNPFHKAAVIKDPIGCLLTEYLVSAFGVRPIVMIRHPAAFVASTLRLDWDLSLGPIRDQPELVREHFADDGDFLSHEYSDPVESAAALWRALNKVILNQVARHPDWTVIKLEDLSQHPVQRVHELYDRMELPWTNRIERLVRRLTQPKNPAEASGGRVQDFRRSSAEVFLF